ncbi:hypothetical protein WJX84_008702 [Apatococcus fuscideae]|uniref:Choline transporter-like protein n=1 Tax=Apatococcus fuscideae TaxID=2026836 RepID=A0AAW1SLP9_9CHLO
MPIPACCWWFQQLGDCACRCPYYQNMTQYDLTASELPFEDEYFSALQSTTLSSCPASRTGIPPAFSQYQSSFITAGATGSTLCGESFQLSSQFPSQGPCYAVWAPTITWFNRCIPTLPADVRAKVAASTAGLNGFYNTASTRLRRYLADIGKAKWLIIASGLGGGLVFSLVWMLVLRLCAGFIVWFTVLAANFLLLAVALYCYSKAGLITASGAVGKVLSDLPIQEDPSADDRHYWKIAAFCVTGFFVIIFLLTCVLIRRIRIAIACIKVAAQAVATMPALIFFPVIPLLMQAALIFYWIFVAAYLYSSGKSLLEMTMQLQMPFESTIQPVYRNTTSYNGITIATELGMAPSNSGGSNGALTVQSSPLTCAQDPDCSYELVWNHGLEWMFLYHFIGLLWTSQFIIGIGYVSMAGAVAKYYWAAGNRTALPACTVFSSFGVACRYHLGSIAKGSLFVALLQFFRWIFVYLDTHMKSWKGNSFLKGFLWCISCCLWVAEKIVKFINKNAYIMVAIKGQGYCRSASRAVSLLVSNALRVAVVSVVGDFLIWMGKLCIACAAGLLAFAISDTKYYTDPVNYPSMYLTSPILPIALSILIAYIVASLFSMVYDYAISTIVLCFCEDCESHNGHPQYAPALLLHTMGRPEAHMNS